MSVNDQWFTISARIKSLREAGALYAALQAHHPDQHGASQYLCLQSRSLINEIKEFRQTFSSSLPSEAIRGIDKFVSSQLANAALKETDLRAARAAIIGLAALDGEITYILSARQEQIRIRSERAFLLLQRLLAVDKDVRSKWEKAFKDGEVACERLGAVHLLSQGIYAFKINAEGARTDLVFGEPPDETTLTRAVDGIVLTEWKLATSKNAHKTLESAREQAERYRCGPLAGIELTAYRYLVAVSLEELETLPSDYATETGVTYRHINIAIHPDTPSTAAARSSRRKKTFQQE